MDKKMVAQAMNRLQDEWNAKADEYAGLVMTGSLTAEEAAKSLAGADLKARESIREETGFQPGPGGNIRIAQQAIDSRLPGYKGLVAGRHI